MGRQSSNKLISRSADNNNEIVAVGSGAYNDLTHSGENTYVKSLYTPTPTPQTEMSAISAYDNNVAYEEVGASENTPLIANAVNPRIARMAEIDAQNLEVEPFRSSLRMRSSSSRSNAGAAAAGGSSGLFGGVVGHFGTVTTCDAKDDSLYCKFMRFVNVLMVVLGLLALAYFAYTLYKSYKGRK